MFQCRINPPKISIHVWPVSVHWGSVHRIILWSSLPCSQQRHLDYRSTQKCASAMECSDAESHFWTSPANGKYIPSKKHLEFSPIVIANHARQFAARAWDRVLPRTWPGLHSPMFSKLTSPNQFHVLPEMLIYLIPGQKVLRKVLTSVPDLNTSWHSLLVITTSRLPSGVQTTTHKWGVPPLPGAAQRVQCTWLISQEQGNLEM